MQAVTLEFRLHLIAQRAPYRAMKRRMGVVMSDEINRLLEKARRVEMTPEQAEEQRRSFAYGNTKLENDSITWESVNQAAEELKAKK
jgi:hypothetical protein